MNKYYKIANLVIGMDTCGRTLKQSKKYEIIDNFSPDIIIRPQYNKVLNKFFNYNINSDELEYMATYYSFASQLNKFDAFVLHSSCVVVDDKAYLFSAHSGTGKSTHTKLWLNYFKNRAYILNDDKPVLRLIKGKWYACGSPWSGKDDISENRIVPIAGIAMLERGNINQISIFKGSESIRSFLSQCYRPQSVSDTASFMNLLNDLFLNIPLWKFKCNMNIDSVLVSYNAMNNFRKD